MQDYFFSNVSSELYTGVKTEKIGIIVVIFQVVEIMKIELQKSRFGAVSARRDSQFSSFFLKFFPKIFGKRPLLPLVGVVCPILGARSHLNPEDMFEKNQSYLVPLAVPDFHSTMVTSP